MKIAVLGIRGLPANYGGFETCAEHVTKIWAEQGHDVIVYCRKKRYNLKMEEYNRCRLKYTSSISTKSLDTLSHTLFCTLDVIFRERRFKYIHLYNSGNALFLPLLKLASKKVVISVDGIEWKREKWGLFAKIAHKLGEYLAIRLADCVIVDNKAVYDYYYRKYRRKTSIIPYGAKIIFDTKLANEHDILNKYGLIKKKYFLFVGRLVPEKGVHNLIVAYKRLKTDIPLIIIGDDNNDTRYKASLLKEQSDKIIFLGFKYGEEYEVILKNALLYVSASELEGTSPSLLAAMGAGVCILVNGIEENRYTVADAGYFYAENNLIDLERIWSDLILHPDRIGDMAAKGYAHVVANYRWEVIAEDYLRVFASLSRR